MKLVAAIPARNELGRYLEPCVAHLLEFCDAVRIGDDGSSDGWQEALRGAWGADGRRVLSKSTAARSGDAAFDSHAASRNNLLRFALAAYRTWRLLALDSFPPARRFRSWLVGVYWAADERFFKRPLITEWIGCAWADC